MLRPARGAALAVLLLVTGCTERLYEGPALAPEQVAVIHVGNTIVREIDGRRRRGGSFDVGHFEITPGRRRLVLVFELTARTIGAKTLPAQTGEGTCVLEFAADAGKQYYLGSRPRGDWNTPRWDGAWEGWVRDPTVSDADDVIARCASQPVPEATAPAPAAAPPPTPALPAAPAAAVTPVPAARATIRLGEWNLRSLGRGADKDFGRIAAATDATFDILAVTEILQVDNGHPGYDALLRALGPAWAGLITDAPRPNTPADGAEYYAVLYRRARVRPCAGWAELRYADTDASGRGREPDRFLREPAFGCFEAGDGSAPGVDFLLAVYRARWADGDVAEVAAEVSHLDEVFTAMQLARRGEDDLIIAGDFHLESAELPEATRAADRTRGDGSVLNLVGGRTLNLPDHLLVYDSRATAELLGDAEAVDLRGIARSNAEFYRTVSDHLPIMVRMRASGPDDD